MSRERFEELKEPYALGALPEKERREVEEYLAENPSEQAEIDELSSIASLLALAPEEQEPPDRLRKSLMKQVRSERAGAPETGGAPSRARGWPGRRPAPWRLAGAAAALLIVALLAWNVSLQSELQEARDFQMSAYELQGSAEASGARGRVINLDGERAMLVATGLPPLPEDKTYEMWAIKGDQPESCGLLQVSEGPTIEPLCQPATEADTFAITVEPEGGSRQPTSEPVITADLSSNL